MAKQFFCHECRDVGGCILEDRNDWAAAPAYCPYDRGRAKWREMVPGSLTEVFLEDEDGVIVGDDA